jgi:hypothetical protein
VTKIEVLEIQIHELKYELMKLRNRNGSGLRYGLFGTLVGLVPVVDASIDQNPDPSTVRMLMICLFVFVLFLVGIAFFAK